VHLECTTCLAVNPHLFTSEKVNCSFICKLVRKIAMWLTLTPWWGELVFLMLSIWRSSQVTEFHRSWAFYCCGFCRCS